MERKWAEEEQWMPDESEFKTAALKPREVKAVWTRGTYNRLMFAERRERVGVMIQKGEDGGKQTEWCRESVIGQHGKFYAT